MTYFAQVGSACCKKQGSCVSPPYGASNHELKTPRTLICPKLLDFKLAPHFRSQHRRPPLLNLLLYTEVQYLCALPCFAAPGSRWPLAMELCTARERRSAVLRSLTWTARSLFQGRCDSSIAPSVQAPQHWQSMRSWPLVEWVPMAGKRCPLLESHCQQIGSPG